MSIESIKNIFPLIDDSANIFYSKIKQWFQLQSDFHLHCKAISRVDRIVETKFMGLSRVYTCKFKTYEVLKEEDIGEYLYIRYLFVVPNKTEFELTTSGENIPVDISNIFIEENSPKPVILKGYEENIVFEYRKNVEDIPTCHVYIRVNKIYKNEYSQIDIKNTEICYDRLHFEDVYRQYVGRLWVIKKRPSVITTHNSVLDNNYEWKLYNIDSEDNYTLVDSSDSSPTSFGSTIIWPVQYGPGLDHRTSFVFRTHIDNDSGKNPPPESLIPSGWGWVEIRESDFRTPNKYCERTFTIKDIAESFLNTRGIVPSLFPYLFRGLVKEISPKYIECIILMLSYICNMNLRYILCNIDQYPLRQIVEPNPNDTPISLLNGSEDKNKSIKGVFDVSISNQSYYVTYNENTNSIYSNKDKIKAAYDNLQNNWKIISNTLPVPMFPNVKWYYHQWIYALSFKKYLPVKVDSIQRIVFLETSFYTNDKCLVLDFGFLKTNFVP